MAPEEAEDPEDADEGRPRLGSGGLGVVLRLLLTPPKACLAWPRPKCFAWIATCRPWGKLAMADLWGAAGKSLSTQQAQPGLWCRGRRQGRREGTGTAD